MRVVLDTENSITIPNFVIEQTRRQKVGQNFRQLTS